MIVYYSECFRIIKLKIKRMAFAVMVLMCCESVYYLVILFFMEEGGDPLFSFLFSRMIKGMKLLCFVFLEDKINPFYEKEVVLCPFLFYFFKSES